MKIRIMSLLVMAAAAAGCSSRDTDLDRFIAQTKQEPPGGVEPVPSPKPYDKYIYSASAMRSPFVPYAGASASSIRPDRKRNPEFLEGYSLDTLKMKGTMTISGHTYALLQTPNGLIQRAMVGNYVGQNDGRILKIEPSKVTITEIVPDGSGGFIERGAALALTE